ncbi:acetoacetate--CoA ligase [Sciscionella marina]|uniref:acetoacetate--CoA ligase n=1 Tax=Sciscionella marina TaxID=508770 RepID=UPI000475DA6C
MPTVNAEPEVLWRPEKPEQTATARFRDWLRERHGLELADYAELHEWSVAELEAFWSAFAEYAGVRFHQQPSSALGTRTMPGAQWFPGATLNYAEHALTGRADDALAVVFAREDGLRDRVTYGQLRAQVAEARAGLRALGVGRGDRVAAFAPNCVQTLVAFLATASLGAVWSSCSPDFGAHAVIDRFAQIEPKVLIAVDGYHYGGKVRSVLDTVTQVREAIDAECVLIDYTGTGSLEGTLPWSEFTVERGELDFEPVPFDHPLWVLYSSGTTGLPKGIVHGHGGIVVEHLKSLRLQMDLGKSDRFFWFTTTGWMMWNLLVSGLLVGSAIVLYDGSPGYPDMSALWRLAAEEGVTYFGTSAPFIQACLKAGIDPRAEYDLSGVRALGSTGAPLSPEGFSWIGEHIGERVQICSVSGGTDLCTAMVCSAPDVPVWRGELSCAALGSAVAAYDPEGRPVLGEVGELVITEPMPSMPLRLWGDADGSKEREAYYEMYPGIWRHGDWITITERGSAVIHGRSDSTLNRGGVRMGTAEFYRVVEGFEAIADSLVIDTSAGGAEGKLLCFLVLAPGTQLADVEPELRKAVRSELSPRHVPDEFHLVQAIPRTLNGKKCEVPVKRILAGTPVEKAVSLDALASPEALQPFIDLAVERSG